MLDKVPVEEIVHWDEGFRGHLESEQSSLLEKISGGKMTDEIEKKWAFSLAFKLAATADRSSLSTLPTASRRSSRASLTPSSRSDDRIVTVDLRRRAVSQ